MGYVFYCINVTYLGYNGIIQLKIFQFFMSVSPQNRRILRFRDNDLFFLSQVNIRYLH